MLELLYGVTAPASFPTCMCNVAPRHDLYLHFPRPNNSCISCDEPVTNSSSFVTRYLGYKKSTNYPFVSTFYFLVIKLAMERSGHEVATSPSTTPNGLFLDIVRTYLYYTTYVNLNFTPPVNLISIGTHRCSLLTDTYLQLTPREHLQQTALRVRADDDCPGIQR